MGKKLTKDDLIKISDYLIAEATRYVDEEIADSRIQAERFYQGKPMGSEKPGRSKVVSTDVRDAIEWTLPTLLKMYFSSDHLIEWTGVGANDTKAAKLLTQIFDYVLLRKNGGFMVFYNWFKDALKKRIGFVTAYWQEEEEIEPMEYFGMTEPEYRLLISDEAFYEEETEMYEDSVVISNPLGGSDITQNVKFYDVKGSYTHKASSIRIECIPPEEIFTLKDTKSCEDSRFWLWRSEQVVGDLTARGYKIPDDLKGGKLEIEGRSDEEIEERHRYGSGDTYVDDDSNDPLGDLAPSMRKVWFYNMDMRLDMDGTGELCWYKVCRVGREIIGEPEKIPYPAYPSITPVPNPHTLIGDGYYELIGEFQKLKTSLHRIMLDYFYFATNPRSEIATEGWHEEFTLSDWSNNTPNGAIRVRTPGTVTPLNPAPLNAQYFNLLQYVEQEREKAVGVSRLDQGQAANSQQAATSMSSLMTQAAMRIELIARVFGETGITQLANLIKDLLVEYPDMSRNMVVQLQDEGEFTGVEVDELRGAYNFIVSVGTGNADKTQMLESLLALFGLYEKFMSWGAGPMGQNQMVGWNELHNAHREFVKAAGLKNITLFAHDPTKQPDIPPPPPQKDAQTIAAEAQAQYLQSDLKVKQYGEETKRMNVKIDSADKRLELAVKERIERMKLQLAHDKNTVDAFDKGVAAGKPQPQKVN